MHESAERRCYALAYSASISERLARDLPDRQQIARSGRDADLIRRLKVRDGQPALQNPYPRHVQLLKKNLARDARQTSIGDRRREYALA